jgi:hypothetical protein
MNVELLERVKTSILADKEFNMTVWDHCIGGHCHLASNTPIAAFSLDLGSTCVQRTVCELLGIDHEPMRRLCFGTHWPADLQKYGIYEWWKSPILACERIDHFIATNGTDIMTEPTPEPAFSQEEELVCA